MSHNRVHMTFRGNPACGASIGYRSSDPISVTCEKCKETVAWKVAMAKVRAKPLGTTSGQGEDK